VARPRTPLVIKSASPTQAARLHALIADNVQSGHLLPRTLDEIRLHIPRFVVAMRGRRLAGCADLAALSQKVAEVRSLVVTQSERGNGVGQSLVEELRARARAEGFDKLCAFTHAPAYFAQMGFSIVPHLWLPEKVLGDCVACQMFHRCGQTAMEVTLDEARDFTEVRVLPMAGRSA
jgi:N-acetylglutamate synthase-like GNAT family acetyltransferase